MLSLTLPLPAWFLLHDILVTCLALNVPADSIRCHNRGIVLGPPHPIFIVLMELPMFTVPTDLLYSIFTVSVDLSLFYVYCPNRLISMDAIESFFYGLTPIRHLEIAIACLIYGDHRTRQIKTLIFLLPLPYSSLVVSTACPGLIPGIRRRTYKAIYRRFTPNHSGEFLHPLYYYDCWHRESGPCLSPSVADHLLGLATDHLLCKLLPHQLANQTRAPPRAGSSFCSSAYGVLAAVSSCCSPPKGRFLRITHPFST
ncbi:hypothetical protein Gotri_000818 [Gossypium trilobum]|uniref:Uncharacterized protein n=1 Tax=Gossypium trilobum TaxID=34281 RepID=A0A7J9FCW5_9ROSI|nr:hypothetical protein [Gossypium trilobum]